MKTILPFLFLFIYSSTLTLGQQSAVSWDKLIFLIGSWKGEGKGKPGEGEGRFTFNFDLDKRILVRKSHSEYPAAKDKPSIVHDDLLIIYPGSDKNQDRAIYFDNEGHVINYSVSIPGNSSVVFTSDKIESSPIFRLTYSMIDSNTVNTTFEISQDGEKYITYVEGKSKRTY